MPDLTVNQRPVAKQARKYTPPTAPISLALPTEQDLLLDGQLLKTLRTFGIFEDETELQHRATVVEKLDALFKEWMKEICQEKNLPPDFIETVGGKIFTFGSYRLGVHAKGGDIDALCVAPQHVEREDFFTSFYEKLKQQEEAKNVHAARDAFVPIINLVFDGVEIDLLFARLPLKRIPNNLDLLNDALIKNIDLRCLRSLNGCRVTQTILEMVPNVDTFRLALMAIKLWAKRRDIYSSALGFLGGVSWAILLARICQLYPNAAAATLVCKFFRFYIVWIWPNPTYLTKLMDLQFGYPFWDPRVNPLDRTHLMPIITPCYPQQNSAFNVTASTRDIIVEEIKRGFQVTQEIQPGIADWSKLFEMPNFFQKYKHYIVLVASAPSEKQGSNWFRLVGSQIRHFVVSLEKHGSFAMAHIHPQSFRGPGGAIEKQRASTMWLIGVAFQKTEGSEILNVDLTQQLKGFADFMYTKASRNNIWEDGLTVSAKYAKRNHLHHLLPQLTHTINSSSTASTKKRKRSLELQQVAKKRRVDSVNEEASGASPPSTSPRDSLGSTAESERSSSSDVETPGKKSNFDSTPPRRDEADDAELAVPAEPYKGPNYETLKKNAIRFRLKRNRNY